MSHTFLFSRANWLIVLWEAAGYGNTTGSLGERLFTHSWGPSAYSNIPLLIVFWQSCCCFFCHYVVLERIIYTQLGATAYSNIPLLIVLVIMLMFWRLFWCFGNDYLHTAGRHLPTLTYSHCDCF